MSSQPDDEAEAGPGGLTTEEELGDSDEDEICQKALDRFERQRAFQTHLLEQSGGGGLDASVGTFDFELQPFVDRQSSRLEVRERHFNTQLRQRGNFIANENISRALRDGLHRAVNQVLVTTPDLHDQDRLYFTIGSNRLHNNFQGWALQALEWREGGERLDALFDRLAQPSTAMNNLKWMTRSNYPLLKSLMPLREPANPDVANPETPRWKS